MSQNREKSSEVKKKFDTVDIEENIIKHKPNTKITKTDF